MNTIINPSISKEKILNLPLLMYKQKIWNVKWNSKISGIYAWINEINGKMYIGQTVNFYKRIYDEMNGFKNKRHQNMFKLFNSIQKHGINNFRVVKLFECPRQYLNKLEILLIEYYDTHKNGYNCNDGGNGNGGHIVTPEQIKKHKKWSDHYWTDEQCKLQSEKMKVWFDSKTKDEQDRMKSGNDWWLNKELKEKHLINTRKSLTPERIERARISLKKHYVKYPMLKGIPTNYINKLTITSDIFSPTGESIKINGLVKFCKQYKIDKRNVVAVLQGKKIHHKGWHIDPNFIFIPESPKKIISPDGIIYEFQSVLSFCKEHNINHSGIKHVLSGKYKHYKLWRLPETSLEEAINNKNSVYKNVHFQFPDNHIEQIIDRKQFCEKYGYSQNCLYNFLKKKSIGDMFYLSVVGKPTCFSGWDERQQYNKLTCLTQRYIIIDTIE